MKTSCFQSDLFQSNLINIRFITKSGLLLNEPNVYVQMYKYIFVHFVLSLSRVELFATPWTVACQAPLFMGILQKEYWRRLPCPPTGDLPSPGKEPRSPALQVDSLPSDPPGEPKNASVGSLSCLQGIFLTQESNQDFLHCKWILFQLSYHGSPMHM